MIDDDDEGGTDVDWTELVINILIYIFLGILFYQFLISAVSFFKFLISAVSFFTKLVS